MTRFYLTLPNIIGIHEAVLRRFGGAGGVRNLAAADAAVARPRCGWYADVAEEACALCESLLMNHPFIDGNKRTAFAALDVFLRLNGIRLEVQDSEMHRLIMRWIAESRRNRLSLMVQDVRIFARYGKGLLLAVSSARMPHEDGK